MASIHDQCTYPLRLHKRLTSHGVMAPLYGPPPLRSNSLARTWSIVSIVHAWGEIASDGVVLKGSKPAPNVGVRGSVKVKVIEDHRLSGG
jgi:hypothetical protein